MTGTLRVQGRDLSSGDLGDLRQLILDHPAASRRELSQRLARYWQWTTPGGQLKDMAARSLMLKLHQRGLIELPARRQIPATHRRGIQTKVAEIAQDPIVTSLSQVGTIDLVRLGPGTPSVRLFDALLHQHHYLGYRTSVGENMKYLAFSPEGRPLACLLFGSAAWKARDRDAYIGWDPAQRESNLQGLTNNSRFLILPWVRVPHLASHLLAKTLARLRKDWLKKYGHPVHAVETFVDRQRFRGTCYRAANWIHVGTTRGRSRNDRHHSLDVGCKDIYLYPLVSHFSRRLRQRA